MLYPLSYGGGTADASNGRGPDRARRPAGGRSGWGRHAPHGRAALGESGVLARGSGALEPRDGSPRHRRHGDWRIRRLPCETRCCVEFTRAKRRTHPAEVPCGSGEHHSGGGAAHPSSGGPISHDPARNTVVDTTSGRDALRHLRQRRRVSRRCTAHPT